MTTRIHAHRRGGFVVVLGVVAAVTVVASPPTSVGSAGVNGARPAAGSQHPAKANPRRITGTLNKPGYTVIALAANGRARSVRARTGTFRLLPPAARVTLQLRSPGGKYAGPIVVGRQGGRALVGVRAGARLGRVVVHPGYGRVSGHLQRAAVDTSRWARHRVPIGVGRFGRVRSKPPNHPPAGDRDADGIPDAIDIDDDGDLIIDNVDRSKARVSAQAIPRAAPDTPELLTGWIKSSLGINLFDTANANSPALADAITRALPESGTLMIGAEPGDLVELDCGGANQSTPRAEGLIYCSRGGTGKAQQRDGNNPPFPDAFDPDGNGMGNLTPSPSGEGNTLFLLHGATAAQIGTGDVLVQRITHNGIQTQTTETVQYIFATDPALVSYDDGHGGSATIPYPVPWGAPGTVEGNGFPVTAGPNGHVVVRLTFWRPQRAPIPPETAPWIDIGHLSYGVNISETGDPCPASSLSNPSPSLVATPAYAPEGGMLTDQADDRPADPANTLSFTVDLTGCLAANGFSFKPHTTAPWLALVAETCGDDRCTGTGASTGPDEANQLLYFTRH
jgi:hypothetical protein